MGGASYDTTPANLSQSFNSYFLADNLTAYNFTKYKNLKK